MSTDIIARGLARSTSTQLASSAEGQGSGKVGYSAAGVISTSRTVQEKLREIVSVKDFGARGDGVTDDTPAIQSAISSVIGPNGGGLYFPKGTYMLTDKLYIPVSYGWRIFGESRHGVRLRQFANNTRIFSLEGNNTHSWSIETMTLEWNTAQPAANTQATANWGTAVANFKPSAPANSADVAVTVTGPSSVTAGTNATYTVRVTNNGPNPATGVVLTDTLPAGATFVSMTQTGGTDAFTFGQSAGTVTETATATVASGSSDTFTLIVSAPANAIPGTAFSDSASVTATTSDPNAANNTATASGQIVGPSADLSVTNLGPTTATEGDTFTYTVTVTNNDSLNAGTGVVLTDTLGANLKYVSAAAPAGVTFSQSGGTVTFTVGTLAPGASVTVTVTVQALEHGTLTNSAAVSATSADPVSANNSAAASTSVAEAPILVSPPITTTGKSLTNAAVATFTHANGIEPASAFSATINWGDGKTSTGTITLSGTTYTVTGSHRYARNGSYTITTTVTELSQAAILLLGKVGDEVPDLPARYRGNADHGPPSFNDQTNEFAQLVRQYLSPLWTDDKPKGNDPDKVTAADLRTALKALYDRGATEGRQPPLVTIAANFRARRTPNVLAQDVLNLLDEFLTDRGP